MSEASRPGALQRRILLIGVLLVSVAFVWMIRSFLMALFLAALTSAMVRPVYLRLVRLLGGREVPAAIILVLTAFIVLVGPSMALVGLVVGQAFETTEAITPWVQEQIASPSHGTNLLRSIPMAERVLESELLPDQDRLIEAAGRAVQKIGSVLVEGAATAGRLTASFVLQLFIMLYAMFFFLHRGPDLLDHILHLIPLESAQEDRLLERFTSVTRATLRGSILIGLLQGTLAGVAFWLAGVPAPAFWGTVMVVFSVIPGIGSAVIWIPAVLWLLGTNQILPGVLLGLWCGLVVGSVDNFLRPRLVGSDARMSDLMILLSTLGGIGLFGPLGFVTGPILAALFSTSWDLYAETFADVLPETGRRTD